MVRVLLVIQDAAIVLTLRTLLEAGGNAVVDREPDVVIVDSAAKADQFTGRYPVLILSSASEIPAAIGAMRRGAFGYIFLPLQPGEAALMVDRAAAGRRGGNSDPSGNVDVAPLESVELRHILQVLRQCKYNQAKAARALGIGRNTLWRKLKRARDTGLIDEAGRPLGRPIAE